MFKERRFDVGAEPDAECLDTGGDESLHEVVDSDIGVGANEDGVGDFKVALNRMMG